MMFWWKGFGSWIVLGAILMPYYGFKELHLNLPTWVTFATAAVICAPIGYYLDKKRQGMDSFMSIPVKYWTLVNGGIAAILFWNPALL